MKILFLDIDGVLNCSKTTAVIGDNVLGIDPELVKNFNRIIDAHPDVKIVISSTWRRGSCPPEYDDFEGLKAFLARQGLRGEIIDHTPYRFGYLPRGQEIRMWLERKGRIAGVDKFVILDDDTSAMKPWPKPETFKWESQEEYEDRLAEWEAEPDLRPNHVITKFNDGGLQDRHVELAIRVLNGEKVVTFGNPPED